MKSTRFQQQIDADTGREETFGLMLEKSIKCAIWLKSQNVLPGDVVGICTHNQMDMYVPCFTALYIGAIFNPWWALQLAPGWIHSGDVVYYDEEGNVFVTNRLKELIKCKVHHVTPSEVEEVILRHPGVRATTVVGVRDALDGEHPFAFVCKTKNSDITEDDVKNLVADTLPDHMQLRGGVAFIDVFPFTASGKVAKAKLREMAAAYIS